MNKIIFKKYLFIYGVCLIAITLDMVTKSVLTNKHIVLVEGVLSLSYVENTGAAWSMFSNSTLFLTIFSFVMVAVIVVLDIVFKQKSKLYNLSIALILSGAIGNLIDRVVFKYVRDFIYFEIIHFPVFNVADICITVGVVLLACFLLFCTNKKKSGE